MVVRISADVLNRLGRKRLTERVLEEIVILEPGMAELAPATLALIANHCVEKASEDGFHELPSVLWFTTMMLRIHPRFASEPSVKAHMARSRLAGEGEKRRIATLVQDIKPRTWDRIGHTGGYHDYFAAAIAGGVRG